MLKQMLYEKDFAFTLYHSNRELNGRKKKPKTKKCSKRRSMKDKLKTALKTKRNKYANEV